MLYIQTTLTIGVYGGEIQEINPGLISLELEFTFKLAKLFSFSMAS